MENKAVATMHDKVAIVTGGSRGLGRNTAVILPVGRPFGDEAFVSSAEKQTHRRLRALPRGRKATLIATPDEQIVFS